MKHQHHIDHPQLAILAREYGFWLYEKQRPQVDLRDLLLGIQDLHGYARPALVAPWKVVRTWNAWSRARSELQCQSRFYEH